MYKHVKRAFDIFFSLIILIIMCIPMLIISFLIWKEDRESPLFIQDRMGKDLVPLKCINLDPCEMIVKN